MATATFDKRIVINQKEAEVLACELKKPPVGPPKSSEKSKEKNDKEVSKWLSSFAKS